MMGRKTQAAMFNENTMRGQSDIGVIGLGVMGENLVMNIVSHSMKVSVYNRTSAKTEKLITGRGAETDIVGCTSLKDFAASLRKPRKVLMLVKAGEPVDVALDQLKDILQPGDVVMDGGNSNFHDSERRCQRMQDEGILFVGMGISGGQLGALHGPSMMPGGDSDAWPLVQPVLEPISAHAADGLPCIDWIGPGGAGHFVKAVHNGIEYGDMQLISEAYDLLRKVGHVEKDDLSNVFRKFNEGPLNSYLIDITGDILSTVESSGQHVIDTILDVAGQKGTGRWTVSEATEMGVPASVITDAVYARYMSADKESREQGSRVLTGGVSYPVDNQSSFVKDVESALIAAKTICYAQGFAVIAAKAKEMKWNLNYASIARMWRGGCIIRAAFLDDISKAFSDHPETRNLLFTPQFAALLAKHQDAFRRVVSEGVLNGVPIPGLSGALAYYDSIRCARLPACLIQAQRDYFGAHTYERVDRPRGEFVHYQWTDEGEGATAGTYNA